jgi:hypothetical protein
MSPRPECASCGEVLVWEAGEAAERTNPRRHRGLWRCRDCYDELEFGIVNLAHLHTAHFPPPKPGGRLEDTGPYQDNAIRDLEEDR